MGNINVKTLVTFAGVLDASVPITNQQLTCNGGEDILYLGKSWVVLRSEIRNGSEWVEIKHRTNQFWIEVKKIKEQNGK